MKQFTIEDIRSWGPCYDPNAFLPQDWNGTAVDILRMQDIPFKDRLWCVLRTDLVSEKLLRLFAVWSYRQTLKWVPNQDPRSLEAASVAERFAHGESSNIELDKARSAAWSAARSAAWSAVLSAYSASSTAESAAESTVSLSAMAATAVARSSWSAWSGKSSAKSAAWSAAWSAASSGAKSAAELAQRDKLIEMILQENKMTEKQWLDFMYEYQDQYHRGIKTLPNSPATWPEVRKLLIKYIAELDNLTEVYNLENTNE